LRNACLSLEPLLGRASGMAELHVPGKADEETVLAGQMKDATVALGKHWLLEDEIRLTGSAHGIAVGVIGGLLSYDRGELFGQRRLSIDFCLSPSFVLSGYERLTMSAAPSTGPGLPTVPRLPTIPGLPTVPGLPAVPGLGNQGQQLGASSEPGSAGQDAGAPVPGLLDEKPTIIYDRPFRHATKPRQDCRRVTVRINYRFIGGFIAVPDAIELDFETINPGEVLREVIAEGLLGGGGGGGLPPLGQTFACAICKCSGDKECGGGRIHTIWMGKTECNSENKKKAQELCNHDSTFLSICDLNQKRKDGKKCSVHHHDFACSDRETEEKCANRQQGGPLSANTLKTDLQALVDAGKRLMTLLPVRSTCCS
jgi:hypothetical protein